jgi:hypothetical protein
MAKRLWRVQGHFPGAEIQVIEVEAGSLAAAMGKACRELKASPALKGKRPKAASFTIQMIGRATADAPTAGYPDSPEQQQLPGTVTATSADAPVAEGVPAAPAAEAGT